MGRGVDLTATLTDHLRDLHMPTIRTTFEEAARRVESESLSYEQYLLELVQREVETRRHNRIERLLRESKLSVQGLASSPWIYGL